MDFRVAQNCPQCGASVIITETARLLTCTFCGTRNYLQSNGPFRYVLPTANACSAEESLRAPYIRFKGTIFLVTAEAGIEYRVVDTTQAANPVPGLPPSLGVRPQAMHLSRIDRNTKILYLPQTLKDNAILAKAAAISSLTATAGKDLYHRAYIGENLSYIYLPLVARQQALFDGVTNLKLAGVEELAGYSLRGKAFDEDWQVHFQASLCPLCGAGLEGADDCQVMPCGNCQTAWAFGPDGLAEVDWWLHPGDAATPFYLPFWKIAAHIPILDIYSFADFVAKTNQPFLPRPEWQERMMSFWIPGVKLRPKIFLQVGRQATLGQWQIKPVVGRVEPNLFPVTLPASEAKQAVKVMLAAATASPRLIYPFLPQVQLTEVMMQLVYLPFIDKGHDWVQPDTGVVIAKNILQFGRSL